MNRADFIFEELKNSGERLALLEEMMQQEQITKNFVCGIMKDIDAFYEENSIKLITSKLTPSEINLFNYKFILETDGRKAYNLHNDDYWIRITYSRKEKKYEVAFMPHFKSGDIYAHSGFSNYMWYVYPFSLKNI